ncbi:MAG: ATP-dependent helicase HrpB [Candidatus Sedimenticola endophacoides]
MPLLLLDKHWLTGWILMLEPRRLAARAAAARMAELLGEAPGGRVGYRVRFDSRVSAATRIEVVTEGILTRRLQRDPALEGVSLVIFDEFHERSLQADLGLALCWDVAHALREDLRLLVMSATLDTEAVAGLLKALVVVGGGRSWPVTVHYRERPLSAPIARATVEAILGALGRERGDLLAFLPGAGEIRQAQQLLSQRLGPEVEICPFYGDLGKQQQDHAIRPSAHGCRRVVLATAIAETSLTIEGVTTVVDSGWARLPAFDPNSGLTRLQTQRVSRASAEQRAGRAGRLGPGVCYRHWSAAEHSALPPHTPAEILGADQAPLALELANWGVGDPAQLAWLDPPPKGAYAQAVELLRGLDALDRKGRITPAGQRMAGLGLHPRLAHMLGYAAASNRWALIWRRCSPSATCCGVGRPTSWRRWISKSGCTCCGAGAARQIRSRPWKRWMPVPAPGWSGRHANVRTRSRARAEARRPCRSVACSALLIPTASPGGGHRAATVFRAGGAPACPIRTDSTGKRFC